MSYRVFIIQRAQKELAAFPKDSYERAREAIRALAEEPRPKGCVKLTAREGWRVRVGRHRVIYEVDDKAKSVTILHVGHRRDVYD